MAKQFHTGIDLLNQRLVNVASPSADTDGANKGYVDGVLNGLAWKQPVRAASTANLTLSGVQTVDGVSLVAGDRVLVKNQTAASANGIYVVASGAWARAADADTAGELVNLTALVSEGAVNADRAFTQTANGPITVGTTNLAFAQVGGSGGQTYTAGTGLTLTGSAFAIDTAVVARKFSMAVGNGTLTTIPVAHNLGTRDVQVSIWNATTFEGVECDVFATDANTVTLTFAVAPTAGQYRVAVVG